MERCAFVGRHAPTADQIRLAALAGYELVPVGDFDAFDTPLLADDLFASNMDCRAVSSAHPLIAFEAIARGFAVLVFRNVNRAAVGAPPQFATDGVLVVYPHGDAVLDLPAAPGKTKWFGDAPQYKPLMGG